jgi:hypothetical protein
MTAHWPIRAPAASKGLLQTHQDGHDFTATDWVLMLSIVIGLLAIHIVVFVLGCLWAWRAGRGSAAAVGAWILVVALESFYVAVALADQFLWDDSYVLLFMPLVPLLIQVALCTSARNR